MAGSFTFDVDGLFGRHTGLISRMANIGPVETIGHMVSLVAFMAMKEPGNEHLDGLSADDIEYAARWNGARGVLFSAFVKSGFLVADSSWYRFYHYVSTHEIESGIEDEEPSTTGLQTVGN